MAEDKKPAKSSRQVKPAARKMVEVMKANAVGRPKGSGQLYDPLVHPKLVYEFCLLGLSLNRCAKLMHIDPATLHLWKKTYEEFGQAIVDGTEGADAAVAKAMFSRATGYSHQDVHITAYQGDVIETPITKHYPPDVSAATFWLKNRAGEKWRDRQEIDNTSSDGSMTPSVIQRVIVRPGEVVPTKMETAPDDEVP